MYGLPIVDGELMKKVGSGDIILGGFKQKNTDGLQDYSYSRTTTPHIYATSAFIFTNGQIKERRTMLLLTAPPRTGKSTAIRKIITCLGRENCAGFWTEQITENGERVGFEINLCSGEKAVLVHVNSNSSVRVSRYGEM